MVVGRPRRASTSAAAISRLNRQKIVQERKNRKSPLKKDSKSPKNTKTKRSILHKGTGRASTSRRATRVSDAGSGMATGTDSEEEDASDAVLPRVIAPSRAAESHENAAWAGPTYEQSMPASYASDSEVNIGDDQSDFDIADDDDNYDDINSVSDVSDDSAAFEAEVEREILAAGEDGINWDEENIYGYNASGVGNDYFIDEIATSDAIYGLGTFDIDFLRSTSPAISELAANETPANIQTPIPSPKLEMDWDENDTSPSNATASNDNASEHTVRSGSQSPSRRASTSQNTDLVGLAAFNLRFDPGQETDDDEIPVATVSSPAVTLSRCNSLSNPKSVPRRVVDYNTPRRPGLQPPVKGKLRLKTDKAVAFSVDGPRVIIFKTPKGSIMKWVDMRRFDGDSDSDSPSSPTMIDLDAAILEGNQRTGAAITDVIYGAMFRQYHCAELDFAMLAQPSSHAEFARVPFLNSGGLNNLALEENQPNVVGSSNFQATVDVTQPEMEMLELIDFDGGVELDNPFSDDELSNGDYPTMIDSSNHRSTVEAAEDLNRSSSPSSLKSAKNTAKMSGDRRRANGPSTPTQTKSGRQSSELLSSPLKRRAPARSASPVLRKKRNLVDA